MTRAQLRPQIKPSPSRRRLQSRMRKTVKIRTDAQSHRLEQRKARFRPPVAPDQKQQFSDNVKDVFFDFDRADLRADDQQVLQQDADWLKSHPEVVFTIAGQADP